MLTALTQLIKNVEFYCTLLQSFSKP